MREINIGTPAPRPAFAETASPEDAAALEVDVDDWLGGLELIALEPPREDELSEAIGKLVDVNALKLLLAVIELVEVDGLELEFCRGKAVGDPRKNRREDVWQQSCPSQHQIPDSSGGQGIIRPPPSGFAKGRNIQ